jgi:acetyl-CoA C-acetyltransferase
MNAEKNGYFKSRIPVKDINGFDILTYDENVRESSLESLAKLNPSFEMMGKMGGFDAVAINRYPEVSEINHVHHPGNSSAIVDGATVAIIGNEEGGKAAGLTPRAKIVSMAMVGTDPTIMLTGPVLATELALKSAGMNINNIVYLK